MKRITLIGTALLLALFITGVFFVWRNSTNNDTALSKNDQILQAITVAFPEFLHNSEPIIKAISVSEPETGWFIAAIQSINSTRDDTSVKIVLHEDASRLRVVAGPDTHFPENKMLILSLPDSVILELRES